MRDDRKGPLDSGRGSPGDPTFVDWRTAVEQRLRGARLDGATEREVADELAQHLEDRYAELTAAGVPADDARAQAFAELDEEGVLAHAIRRTVRRREESIAIGAGGARGEGGA